MRSIIRLLLFSTILFSIAGIISGQSPNNKKNNLLKANYVSLEGVIHKNGNHQDKDGIIRQFISPVLHLMRTKSDSPLGTYLLLPDGIDE